MGILPNREKVKLKMVLYIDLDQFPRLCHIDERRFPLAFLLALSQFAAR
jgi:hypothetical protein